MFTYVSDTYRPLMV